MPRDYIKRKELNHCIPRIYKHNAENIMLFSWVKAQQQRIPTITIDQAIMGYIKFTGIDWDIYSARTTYLRLQKEYLCDCKDETTKTNC